MRSNDDLRAEYLLIQSQYEAYDQRPPDPQRSCDAVARRRPGDRSQVAADPDLPFVALPYGAVIAISRAAVTLIELGGLAS